ncbi:MAG: thioredoxin family protein [Bacteroidales bacterium]
MVHSQIRDIGESDLSGLFRKDNKLKVVEFYETNSGTCEMMLPLFERASMEFSDDVHFYRLDVSGLDDLKSTYHMGIRPLFLFIKDGVIIDKVAGLVPLNRISNMINTHIS